jgi:uncharacterized protein YcnI
MTRLRTVALGVLVTLVALLVLAGPASAHVTISAPGATRGGGDQEITFRVPVEATKDTVGLTVQLPTATPIASVLIAPMPGWTHTQVTTKLAKPITTDDGDITEAVSQITWTAAAGQGIAPGEYGNFTMLAGQLPDAPTLVFKALQKYSDGSVVSWIETSAPGSTTQPTHPAPVLELANASAAASSTTATAAKAPSNARSVTLSIVALVVAAAALSLAVVTRARSRGGDA